MYDLKALPNRSTAQNWHRYRIVLRLLVPHLLDTGEIDSFPSGVRALRRTVVLLDRAHQDPAVDKSKIGTP